MAADLSVTAVPTRKSGVAAVKTAIVDRPREVPFGSWTPDPAPSLTL